MTMATTALHLVSQSTPSIHSQAPVPVGTLRPHPRLGLCEKTEDSWICWLPDPQSTYSDAPSFIDLEYLGDDQRELVIQELEAS